MRRILLLLCTATLCLIAQGVNESLLEASRKGDLAAVKALVEKGAPVETATTYGQTSLYLAAMNGHEAVVSYLLDKGANPDVSDSFYKASVFDFVLMRRHYGVAKLLLNRSKSDPGARLPSLVAAGQPELVKTLLESARPGQPSLDKAYEAALEQKQAGIADLLKKAGAREPAPPVTVDSKTLESYAGTYKSGDIPLDIKESVKEAKLYLQASGQPEFPVKAMSPTQFECAQAGIVVEFDSASSFTLKQGGRSYQFKKTVTP
jgi:hypothetical protein